MKSMVTLRGRYITLLGIICISLLFIKQSQAQTTITTGNTVNASAIPAGNTVTINAGGTLNMDVSRNFASITTNNTGISSITGTGTLTTGSITINAPNNNNNTLGIASTTTVSCTSIVRGSGNGSSTYTINLSGTLINSGTTGNITTFTCNTGSTVEYSGASQTIFQTTYHHLTLSGSGTPTMTGVTTVNGNLLLSGSASVTPVITTIGGSLSLSGTSSLTTGANLGITGSLSIGNGTSMTVGAFTLSVGTTTTIGGGTSGTINFNSATNPVKTFTGDVTLNAGSTWNEAAAITPSFGGNFTNNASTFTASSGNHTFTGSTKVLSGSTITSIARVIITGSYTNSGTLTIGTALNSGTDSGTLINGATGTLNLGGTINTNSGFTLTANTSGNTVNYTGASPTLKVVPYFNLGLSGSGTTGALASQLVVSNSLSITGTILNLGTLTTHQTNTLTLGGLGRASGTWGSTSSGATNQNNTFFSNTGIITVATCNAGSWLGTTSTDWNTSTNWSCTTIPTSTTDVVIPSGGNQPSIGAAGGLARDITINSGATLTITDSNSLSVAGNWSNSGTFNDNTSTVTFTGSSKTIGGSSTTSFYNLTLSGSASVTTAAATIIDNNLTIGNGTTLNLAGFAFTVTGSTTVGAGASGVLNITSATGTKTFTGDVTLNAGSTWNESAAATVNMAGSLTNNATSFTASTGVHTFSGTSKTLSGSTTTAIPNATFSGSYANNGTFTCSTALAGSGSLTQGVSANLNIGGTSAITTLTATNTGNTVTFNGTGQSINATTYFNLTNSGANSLSGAVTVNNTLSLSNRLALGANNLVLGSSAGAISGASSTAYVVTNSTGRLVKTFGSLSSAYTFEVGDASNYSRIILTATAGTFSGSYTLGALVSNTVHPSNYSTTNYLTRYWDVLPSGFTSSPSVNVTGHYVAGDITGTQASISNSQLNGTYSSPSSWITFGTLGSQLTATGAALTNNQSSFFTGTGSCAPITSGFTASVNGATLNGDAAVVSISGGSSPNVFSSGTYTVEYGVTRSAGTLVTAGTSGSLSSGSFSTASLTITPSVTDNTLTVNFTKITNNVSGCSTTFAYSTPSFTLTATGTCNSTGSTNWGQSGTWTCGRVPVATDNVTILAGHSVTLLPNQNPIHDFTIDANGSLTDNNGNPSLTVTGNFTLNGTINASSASFLFSGPDKIFSGTGNVVAATSITLTNNKTIASSSNLVLTSGLIITAGSTVTNLGEISIGGNITGTGTSSSSIWTNSTNATLNIGGTASPPIFNNGTQGVLNASATGNTVNYFGIGSAFNIAIPSSNTYFNLEITGASNTKSIPNNTTIIVSNDLNIHTSGTGAFSCGSGGTLRVRGDWNNTNGTTGFSEGSTGTVIFDGSSAQAITCITNGGSASTETIYNLQVNNAAGITLNNDVVVQGNLYMLSGNVSVGSGKTLSLGTSTSTPGTLSYVSGAVIGQFQRWVTALSGTITTTSGNTGVTGSGTLFSTQLSAGQLLYTADKVLIGTISSIGSNTGLTLTSGASGSYASISYAVYQGVNTGTISVSAGSTAVTGSSTQFTTQTKVGQVITNSSGVVIGRIASIASATSLTLDVNSPITVSAGSYNVETGYNFPLGTAANYRPLFMNISSGYTTGSIVSEFVESFPGNNNLPKTDAGQTIGSTFREGYWTLLATNSFALGSSTRFYLNLTGAGFSSHAIDNTTRLLTGTNNSTTGTPTKWDFDGAHETWSSGNSIGRTGMGATGATGADISSIKGFAFGDPTDCSSSAVASRVLAIGGDTNICANEATGQVYTAYIMPTFSGTISTTSGNSTVTGIGTSFSGELSANDVLLTTDGIVIGTVSSIGSNTSLTLSAGATGTYTGIYYLKTTLAGTISTDTGSAGVTGTSTNFLSLSVGDVLLTLGGVNIGTVSSIGSATSLTLTGNALTTYNGRFIKANKSGTITTSNSSTAVTGSGTSFLKELRPGQSLYTTANTLIGVIATISDDSNLILTGNASNTYSGISYLQIGTPSGASTYTWSSVGASSTTPSGSSLSVNWNVLTPSVGSVTVYETSGGCSSEDRTLSVDLQSIVPSDISGNDDVPQNTDGLKNRELYSTTARSYYTSYIWTVTGGTLFTAATGGTGVLSLTTTQNAVYVKWDDAGTGTVSVQGVTTCGTSNATTLSVNIYNLIFTLNSGAWNNNQNQADFWSCNCVPTATDNIFIRATHTVTIGVTTVSAKNLIIAGTLDTGGNSISVSGNLTFINGILNGSGALNLTGSGKNIDGTGTLNNTGGFNINGAQTVLSSATINSTSTASTTTIANNITLANYGIVTVAGSIIGSNSSSTWTNAAGSTLNVGGNLMVTGTLDASASSNIVNYNGTGAQTVKATQYSNLYFNNTTATGIASPTASANILVSGNWINNGALAVSGFTGFNPNGGTVTFNGTSTISGSATTSFNNLTISGGLTAPSGTINVGGSFTNNGTFSHGSGTVNMNGTAAQSIAGSNSTTFNNLTLAGTGTPVTMNTATSVDAVLTIATGVKANLSTITSHTAQTLILGVTPQTAGTYGGTASSATNKLSTWFENVTGILTVASAKYYSRVDGNWNSNTTWSFSSGGAAVGSGLFPVAGDIVVIEGGRTVTVTAPAACTTINFTTVTASTLAISGSNQLIVSGAINIPRTASGSNTINVLTGTLEAGSIAFTSAGATNGHIINISTGTLKVTNNVTVNGSGNTSPNITITDAGLLQLGGSFFASGDGTLSAASNSTVEYNGAAQMVSGFNYGNLILSTSGTKTLSTGTTSVTGTLSLTGTTAATTVGSLTLGNLNIGNGTTFTVAGFPITVNGTTTVGGGSSGQLTISSNSGTPKQFTGLVTVASNGTWQNSGNSDVNFRGGITNSGVFTAGSGIHTFETNNQALSGTLSIPTVTVTGITLTNNNTLTVGTSLSGTGGLTQASSATLNLGGSASITTLTASSSGNTVNYNGTSQTILTPASSQYVNLSFNGSGIFSAPAATLNVSGNWANSATGVSGSYTGFNPNGGTINFNGNTTLSGSTDNSFNNLTIAGSSSLTASSGILYVGGVFTNGGTFTHGSGTLNFNGATTSIAGSVSPSFNNFTVSAGTLTNTNTPKSFSVAGNLVFDGTFSDFLNEGTVTLNGTGSQTFSGTGVANFYNLVVSNSDAITGVTLNSNQNLYGRLSFTGTPRFNANGNLTLKSTSTTQAGSIGNLTNVTFSGNITVERYLTTSGPFTYISSPVSDPLLSQLSDDFGSNLVQYYDESVSGGKNVGFTPISSGNFESMKGYAVSSPASVVWDVTGPLTDTKSRGNVSFPVSYSNVTSFVTDGWNLLGNPYPSAIDWDSFSSSAGISPVVQVPTYQNGTSTNRTWHRTLQRGSSGSTLADGIIAMGQAFWVKAGTTGQTLSITESVKDLSAGTFYRKNNSPISTIRVSVSRDAIMDESFLSLMPGTTPGFEFDYDGIKLDAPDLGVSLISKEGVPLVYFVSDKIDDDIELEILAGIPGVYTLNFTTDDVFDDFKSLFLIDRVAGVSKPLLNVDYTFESHGGLEKIRNRFYISRNASIESSNRISIYPNPATQNIQIEVGSSQNIDAEVIDMKGYRMGVVELNSRFGVAKGNLDVSEIPAGVYLIKTVVNGSIYMQRFIKQ